MGEAAVAAGVGTKYNLFLRSISGTGIQEMARQPHSALSPSQSTAGPRHTLEITEHQTVRATGQEYGGKMQHSEQLLRSTNGLGDRVCSRGPRSWIRIPVYRMWFSLRCIGSAFYRLKKLSHRRHVI